MNKQRTARAVLLILALAAAASCKKGGSTPPATIDNDPKLTQARKYVTQSPWKETALEYQTAGGAWVAKPLPAALMGYANTFTATDAYGGTYTVTSGPTLVSSGTWLLIGDESALALNKLVTYEFGVLSDTEMQLVLTGQMTYTDPVTNAVTTYYGQRQTFTH